MKITKPLVWTGAGVAGAFLLFNAMTFSPDGAYMINKAKKGQFLDGLNTVYTKFTCSEKGKGLEQLVQEHGQHHKEIAKKLKYNVDSRLLIALEYAESAGIGCAVGENYERSVMQLTDPILHTYKVENPFDVKENIRGGDSHFADLMEKNEGFTRLAIAAYITDETKVYKTVWDSRLEIREIGKKFKRKSKEEIGRLVYNAIKGHFTDKTRKHVDRVMRYYAELKKKYHENLQRPAKFRSQSSSQDFIIGYSPAYLTQA